MRLRFIKTLAFLSFLFCLANKLAANTKQTSSARPNILVILVDDLRWDAIRFAQHPFFRPPNIERLANEGVVFDNSFVTHSLCSPSRATLLTGLYSHQHGVREIRSILNPQLPTVPKLLQTAGYETAFIGKWHISANAHDLQAVFNCDGKPRPEFDFWISFKGQGEYQNPLINVNGIETNATGHITDILTDRALEFLSHEHTRPFFLMLSHKAAHDPFTPQDRFLGIYNNVDVPAPVTYGEDISDKPDFLRCLPFGANAKNRARRYYELLTGIDESVGKILAKLEEKNILNETLIIFTSDNGLMMGAHNIAGKNVAYEESIRLPLFVRYPDWFPAGTVVADDFTLNIDIAPTILEAADVQIPAGLLGISLRRFAAGEAHRKSFLYESFRFQLPSGGVESCLPELRAVRTRDYKYVTYLAPKDKDELYDLSKDPIEADNRINDPAYAGVLQRLQAQLDSLRLVAGDTLKATAVAHPQETAPLEFTLLPNHPNPFNAGTKIQYVLPHAVRVTLKVFDVFGRQVATIVDERQEAGIRTAAFDASRLASGIYFCQLVAGDFFETKKMVLIR